MEHWRRRAMTTLDAAAVRSDFSDVLNRVKYTRERIVICRRGKSEAVLVPVDDIKLLEFLEDRVDLDEARRRLAEGGPRISLADLKAELGL
jgi:prevent-host-death family protein